MKLSKQQSKLHRQALDLVHSDKALTWGQRNDRELLEAAAHAYGLYGVDPRGDDDLWETNATDEDGFPKEPTWGMRTIAGTWNPLTDDGDALRLAVKLRLRVDAYDGQVECMDGCEPFKIGRETFTNKFVKIEPTDHREDEMAATRRAIVRAAAAMQPNGGTTR